MPSATILLHFLFSLFVFVLDLKNIQEVAQSRDTLLDIERNEAEELTGRVQTLESALREKESQLNMLEGGEGLGRPSNPASEIVEVKPSNLKGCILRFACFYAGNSVWISLSRVLSLTPASNFCVFLAVLDEQTTYVPGFKSLAKSRIAPKFTRPVPDMIDGLW
ncbi:hypothetical protein D5086_014054 [Populus alba]|uniref:Uncharacterized protein n=1 Tax=Populus alba TaxID=43335 RepID=A0ACC4C816_POPAL